MENYKSIVVENKQAMEIIKRIARKQMLKEEKQIELKEAVETLCNALKEDEEYYRSWQANIAMVFKDEFDNQSEKHELFTKWLMLENGLHTIANNAADNFLKLLISQ